jgi:hypothetical protein
MRRSSVAREARDPLGLICALKLKVRFRGGPFRVVVKADICKAGSDKEVYDEASKECQE